MSECEACGESILDLESIRECVFCGSEVCGKCDEGEDVPCQVCEA